MRCGVTPWLCRCRLQETLYQMGLASIPERPSPRQRWPREMPARTHRASEVKFSTSMSRSRPRQRRSVRSHRVRLSATARTKTRVPQSRPSPTTCHSSTFHRRKLMRRRLTLALIRTLIFREPIQSPSSDHSRSTQSTSASRTRAGSPIRALRSRATSLSYPAWVTARTSCQSTSPVIKI